MHNRFGSLFEAAAMGKKKLDDAGAGSKSKTNAKDVKKDKVISVSAMLASMD
ncbi:hypothetical protein QQ045_017151 [Rhodiola kirilowii]